MINGIKYGVISGDLTANPDDLIVIGPFDTKDAAIEWMRSELEVEPGICDYDQPFQVTVIENPD